MPIANILQPELVTVTPALRLRRFEEVIPEALDWYRDPETVYLVDGIREPYSREKLERMYRYLDAHGELYYIELLEQGVFRPIGDVAFSREDMPLVIGEAACRGKGIGRAVVAALIARGRSLGFDSLGVREIYSWNPASRRFFESQGFRPVEATPRGHRSAICLIGH